MTREELDRLTALAKVGIEALVDEATGFQKVREGDALRKRLELHGGGAIEIRAIEGQEPGTASFVVMRDGKPVEVGRIENIGKPEPKP